MCLHVHLCVNLQGNAGVTVYFNTQTPPGARRGPSFPSCRAAPWILAGFDHSRNYVALSFHSEENQLSELGVMSTSSCHPQAVASLGS